MSTPKSIQALITARLDRLDEEDRAVLQRASVVGKVFYWGAVTDLSPQQERGHVGSRLQALLRKELIQPEPSPFAGEDAFRFSHILVRDAAYESMPKRRRAEMHERFAGWLEDLVGDRLPEYEEIIGHHLEQAFHYLSELGPPGDHGLTLGSSASMRLGSAGRRAFARGDVQGAHDLLRRAVDLLPTGDSSRVELLPEFAAVLMQTGAFRDAETVLKEAMETASSLGDVRSQALAVVRRTWLGLHTQRFASNRDALPDLDRAITTFEELRDDGGLAEALTLAASIEFWSGNAGVAVLAADRAIRHARRANDARRESEALRVRSGAEAVGPTNAADAATGFEALMHGPVAGHGGLRMSIAMHRALMEAMRGNAQVARDLMETARALAREFGLQMHYAGGILRVSGEVAMLAGESELADQELREAVSILRQIGDPGHLSSVLPVLADISYAQGRVDEALALSEEAERASIEGDMDAQIGWRRVKSKILAHQGHHAAGLKLATEAADLARRTDYLDVRGTVCLDLAEVLRLVGRGSDALPVMREAIEMFELKGNAVMSGRARAWLASNPSIAGT